ncbi:transcription antitermination factor NusB [Flavobacteriales bacterium]|jgi:transcription antitermination protein NusB|nr:transcription antitermination factor NusB [Flavobacteriales bacterium]
MLSRRHIRVKVMQSLYSYLSTKVNEMPVAERAMLKHFDEVVELKLVIISLWIQLVKHADNFYDEGKKKYLPTSLDLNPNTRFVDNDIITSVRNDLDVMDKVSKFSGIWIKNDHDIVHKLFKELYQSDLYQKYIANENNDVEVDKKFIINALNDYILKNELVHHIFEERSIYWVDDLPFIAAIIFGDIKEGKSMDTKEAFKDSSDKEFALKLFRNTINNNSDYEEIIIKFARNWEIDRIAKMDQLFLKMAFAEILSMPDLPIKVSMNEYIEISKYYSTPKSKLFVNGLLDNFVKTYTREGKIKKIGRGLV